MAVTSNLVPLEVIWRGCLSNVNSSHWGVTVRVGLGFSIDNTIGGTTYGRGLFTALHNNLQPSILVVTE